jgi:hypothetical protein
MQSLLIACASRESAERVIGDAVDLSVACGARLSVVYAPQRAAPILLSAGLEAASHLSNVLFTQGNGRSPMQGFIPPDTSWLATLHAGVNEFWETDPLTLPDEVRTRKPDLMITCDRGLARILVEQTAVPLWVVRRKQRLQPWILVRKLRCAVRGSRATEWASAFAAGLGAEIETVPAGVFTQKNADLVVVTRGTHTSLLSSRAIQPVVVV